MGRDPYFEEIIMKCTVYSHCDGDKTMPAHLQKEILTAISSVSIKPAKRTAPKIRDSLLANLRSAGWSGEVSVSRDSDITITSVSGEVGLCLQTGNMARMYADLIKLQTMYLDNAIKSAALVLPSSPASKLLGENIADAKRLQRELPIFRKAYHVPTLVFALE
jgi:hypothetical protein